MPWIKIEGTQEEIDKIIHIAESRKLAYKSSDGKKTGLKIDENSAEVIETLVEPGSVDAGEWLTASEISARTGVERKQVASLLRTMGIIDVQKRLPLRAYPMKRFFVKIK